jgi:hypothetical protein
MATMTITKMTFQPVSKSIHQMIILDSMIKTKFDCVLCKMSFDNVPAFIQHVSSHAPSEDVGENVGLNTDIRLQGNSKTIYICRCCDKEFANYDFVKDHLSRFLKMNRKI